MNPAVAARSPLFTPPTTSELLCPITVEPIGPNNIVRINQPEHLPILASLSNTWRVTATQKEIDESLQLHFIATTESGQQLLIFQDLYRGTWSRQYETTSDQKMVHSTV